MTRRRPGQSAITTPRDEKDRVEIQSGTEFGVTLGTPIGMRVLNENQRPKDYGNSTMDLYPRPSHADWTYLEKYGVKASSGGGRSSARETIGMSFFFFPLSLSTFPFLFLPISRSLSLYFLSLPLYFPFSFSFTFPISFSFFLPLPLPLLPLLSSIYFSHPSHLSYYIPTSPSLLLTHTSPGRVAAGAIAEKYLREAYGIEIVAFTSSIGAEHLFPPTTAHPTPSTNPEFLTLIDQITRQEVDSFLPVRCPNTETTERMSQLIADFRDKQDSIGGNVTCVIRNCPTGLGEPCFDKLEAKLAHAMLSIPATKGFEVGSGFGGTQVPGSIHNDPFVVTPAAPATHPSGVPRPRLTTKTNNSGGIQGGISNGAHIYFTVGFKPPATIGQAQSTVTYDETEGVLEAKGRHDPCVVPRAIPIVEAMAALVIMDAVLAQSARSASRSLLPALPQTISVAKAHQADKDARAEQQTVNTVNGHA